MPSNYLQLLKGEGLAVQAIKVLVNQPNPAEDILQQVSNMGLQIRPDVGTQIINYLRSTVIPSGQYIENLENNVYPALNRIPFAVTNMLRNFAYTVEINGTDSFTGSPMTSNITVSSSQLLTKQQAIDAAVNMSAGEGKSGGVTGGSGEIVSIVQNNAGLVTDTNPLGASGPYTPINYQTVRTRKTPPANLPYGYSSLADYYRDIS